MYGLYPSGFLRRSTPGERTVLFWLCLIATLGLGTLGLIANGIWYLFSGHFPRDGRTLLPCMAAIGIGIVLLALRELIRWIVDRLFA